MSVSKVQRSKSATSSVIYAVWGSRKAMEADDVRAAVVSVVGPHGEDPLVWAIETRDLVGQSTQRRNETINIIQSFSPDELDPDEPLDVEKAHAAGLALAAEVAPDCDVVVATHTDTAHVHNHIIVANHDRVTGLAAPKDAGNAWRVRVANDEVMKSLGLEVLERDPVSYSRDERIAQSKGLDIDGSELSLSELTRENWREFARARIEELVEDDRVIAALNTSGDNGVEPALDVMADIASEYHLSFSRRGKGKRKNERSSFALLDENGDELRVKGSNGRGNSKAATAGSRLGSDYTLNGLRARLHELHAQQIIDELELDNGSQQAPAAKVGDGQLGVDEQVGYAAGGSDRAGRGGEVTTYGDTRGRGESISELSEATERLERANGNLETFNSRDERVRGGDGSSDSFDEGYGGYRGGASGSDSTPAREFTELGNGDSGAAKLDGRAAEDRARARRRTIELERRRRRALERERREALESDGSSTGQSVPGPEF